MRLNLRAEQRAVRDRRRRFVAVSTVWATVIAALVVALPIQSETATAADGRDWDAGFIISDEIFFDGAAMTSGEIQTFLNGKVSSCRSGYTCLKDYRENTPNRSGEAGRCGPYAGASSESAATIIAKVGVACGVSQKAIIVLLEKEQSLITDTWPTSRQYRSATGYGCPDTADCDTAYYGFFNQVWMAALQFKRYAANPTGWRHVAGRTVDVLYHPNSACGSSPVYIMNQATAGLYNYTPYQPNASALANLYGTGDGCGAYGNRNFWRIFTDWFGPTRVGPEYYIERVYRDYGGSSGALGAATTGIRSFSANGGGAVKGYQNGAIAWSASRGAFAVTGAIRSTYGAWGGVEGWIGWPASAPNVVSDRGGGIVQSFQNAAIASSGTGTWPIPNPNRAPLASLGGISGELGWPTGEDTCGTFCSQPFQGGTIYRTSSGAFAVPLDIAAAYGSNGGPGGLLGPPVGSVVRIADSGGGRVQAFKSGAIAVSSAGAFAITEPIRSAFNSAGGIAGAPGWPTGAVVCDAGNTCSQTFSGGTVLVSAGGDARYLDSRIAGVYLADVAALGKTVSGVVGISAWGEAGIVQAFEGGAIAWSPTGGAHALRGGMRAQFGELGGIGGLPGWPVGDMNCNGDVCAQQFRGGLVLSSPTRGAIVDQEFVDRYIELGAQAGALGWPTSARTAIPASGGGAVMAFEGGALASSAAGVWAVSGGLRTFYNSMGGVGGPAGWPSGAMTCGADNECTQQFVGGTIVWSPATGGRFE